MKNKIFYSAVILGNLNNIRCTEEKVNLIKYVVNNKVFTGGNNFKFKKNELKIKDIIDIENVRKKAGKKYLPNNKLDDLSTPDESHSGGRVNERFVNSIFYFGVKNNKLKLTKVEKIKYIKEKKDDKENIKEEKTEYKEGSGIKDGKLINLEEVIEKDTDYIFYYNYNVTFPKNSLHITYNNIEYINNDEIKLNCDLDPKLSNIDNFFNQVKDNVVNEEGKKLSEELNKKTSPIHILNYDINFNKASQTNWFQGDDTFYEQLLHEYDSKSFVSLYLTIDKFYKYNFIFKQIKGYEFKYDKKEKKEKIITKLNEHQDQQFTEDSLNDFIKKDLFLKDGYYKVSFDKPLNTDKKIDEDNIIRINFNIDKIKNDNDSKQFISTYLKEKQYVYKYRITNTPSGYKFKSDILKNADENGCIKGKLNTIEEVKAKIKEDLDLEDGDYELENITDLENDFKYDSERIEINIKIKNDDKLKDKMFEKIPQKTTNGKASKTSNGKDNGNDNGDNKGGNKNGCCGSNN